MSVLFHTETYDFILDNKEAEGRTGARILRISGESGEETLLLDYLWPAQLTVEVEAGNVLLREDGVLCWELHVTAHHVKGMALNWKTRWAQRRRWSAGQWILSERHDLRSRNAT